MQYLSIFFRELHKNAEKFPPNYHILILKENKTNVKKNHMMIMIDLQHLRNFIKSSDSQQGLRKLKFPKVTHLPENPTTPSAFCNVYNLIYIYIYS